MPLAISVKLVREQNMTVVPKIQDLSPAMAVY